MSKKIKVYCAHTSNGTYVDSQAFAIREIERTYGHLIEFVYPFNCIRRTFHDHARNRVAEDFLASDCDVLWFLDSDITPGIQVMDLVAIHYDKWKVAGLTYPVFMTVGGSVVPEVVYTVYSMNKESNAFSPTVAPTKGIEFVDGIATGCLLIKREVLEAMDAPYFEFSFDKYTRDLTEGEDLNFAKKVYNMGHRFLVDFSTLCRHTKTIDLLDVNNYAIQYANKSVLNYDAHIRSQVQPALDASYKNGYAAGLKASQNQTKKIQIVPGNTPLSWHK